MVFKIRRYQEVIIKDRETEFAQYKYKKFEMHC